MFNKLILRLKYFNIYKTLLLLSSIWYFFACTNELPKKNPLFSSSDTNIRKYIYENQEDPQVKELLNTSRDNTRNLPDIIDFGVLELNEQKKYTVHNVYIENGNFSIALYIYDTQDSISFAPLPDKTGNYNGSIYLNWIEKDNNGNDKDYSKLIELKAIVVEKKTIKDEDNPIIEIWKDKNLRKIYRN